LGVWRGGEGRASKKKKRKERMKSFERRGF